MPGPRPSPMRNWRWRGSWVIHATWRSADQGRISGVPARRVWSGRSAARRGTASPAGTRRGSAGCGGGRWHPAPHPGRYGPRSRAVRPSSGWYEDALELFQRVGDDWGPIDAQAGLGAVSYCTGISRGRQRSMGTVWSEPATWAPRCSSSVRYSVWPGLPPHPDDPRRAPACSARPKGSSPLSAHPLYPRDQPVRERALAALTAALGQERLAAAREAGRALTLEAAIAEAQAVAEAVMASP